MKVYIITDTHFGHGILVNNNHREMGYETKILENLSKLKGDLLIHLGDICIGGDEFWHKKLMEVTQGFKKKILIRGNHDNKSYNWYYNNGWDSVSEIARMRLFGKEIVFSHMPILAENIETSPYKKVDINIHGHLHGNGKYSHRAVEGYSEGFHYDCAVDTHNFKPVDLEKLLQTNESTPQ